MIRNANEKTHSQNINWILPTILFINDKIASCIKHTKVSSQASTQIHVGWICTKSMLIFIQMKFFNSEVFHGGVDVPDVGVQFVAFLWKRENTVALLWKRENIWAGRTKKLRQRTFRTVQSPPLSSCPSPLTKIGLHYVGGLNWNRFWGQMSNQCWS